MENEEERKKIVENAILMFIDVKCKEAADFFCNPKDDAFANDTIMNNLTFYKQNPKVFELQSKIIQNPKNFNKFTPTEKALWFALEPTVENINTMANFNFKHIPVMKKSNDLNLSDENQSLIEYNMQLIERAKLIIKDQSQKSAGCIEEIHQLLIKGWAEENRRISDIYNEEQILTVEFYSKIYKEIIYPKIQSRLKIYAKVKNIPYFPFPYLKIKNQDYSSIPESFSTSFYGLDKTDRSIPEQFSVPNTVPIRDNRAKGNKRRRTKRNKRNKHYSKKRR
jgi:hypothetical protein